LLAFADVGVWFRVANQKGHGQDIPVTYSPMKKSQAPRTCDRKGRSATIDDIAEHET
jgi:hypothetical protein